MALVPHLYLRGSVYQWRRRFRQLSTSHLDLKVSLATTDRRHACILARRLSAESDTLNEQLQTGRITGDEARAFIRRVVRKERQKICDIKMNSRAESFDAMDDLRHDEAMAEAYGFIDRYGLRGSTADLKDPSVRMKVELERQVLRSEAHIARIHKSFREITGRERISARETTQLINLVITGKRAAWSRHRECLTPLADLAAAELEAAAHLVAGIDLSDASPIEPVAIVEEKRADVTPSRGDDDNRENCSPDPSISAVVERLCAVKRDERIEEKTLKHYYSCAALFVTLTDIEDVRHIKQSDIKRFRGRLHMVPKNFGRSQTDRQLTWDQIKERAAPLTPDEKGFAVGTVNRYLEHLALIAGAARDEGISVDPLLNPNKLRLKDGKRAREKRSAFTCEQLAAVFRSPVWSGSQSERRQTRPGRKVFKNGVYWVPLIAAYSGARREEIAGLSPKDIRVVEDVLVMAIEDNDLRRIKTLASRRIVPIHSHLIELGFQKYVDAIRKAGHPDLFPDLREPKSGSHGRKIGRRMSQIVAGTLGPAGSGLTLHSCRHYVQNVLEDREVSDKVIRDLVGHEGADIHERHYSKASKTGRLQEAVEMLPRVF